MHTQRPPHNGRLRRNPNRHSSLTVPKSDGVLTPLGDRTAVTGPACIGIWGGDRTCLSVDLNLHSSLSPSTLTGVDTIITFSNSKTEARGDEVTSPGSHRGNVAGGPASKAHACLTNPGLSRGSQAIVGEGRACGARAEDNEEVRPAWKRGSGGGPPEPTRRPHHGRLGRDLHICPCNHAASRLQAFAHAVPVARRTFPFSHYRLCLPP